MLILKEYTMENNNKYQIDKALKSLAIAKDLERKQIKEGARWHSLNDPFNTRVLTKDPGSSKMIEYINLN
jgi:hypothetical protein